MSNEAAEVIYFYSGWSGSCVLIAGVEEEGTA